LIARPPLQLAGAPPKAKRAPARVKQPTRIARWLSARHSLAVEAASVLALYATYEAARGLVAGNQRVAIDHAHTVAALERKLHLFLEPNVQHAARALPGLLTLLGGAYLTLHLPVTAGLLLWLYKRRPAAFARIRTTLLVASAFALIGFVLFPTAPPRLAGLGITDTVSAGHVNLNKGLVRSVYNPFAAVPSMHIGYALIVAAALVRLGNTRTVQLAGVVYPLLVLLVIVATGNHFFFDAAAGAIVVVAAYLAAFAIGKAGAGAVTETSEQAAAVCRLPHLVTAQRVTEEELAA
jgi:PAP2 superfamily